MSNEHVEALRKAREALVEERRRLAVQMVNDPSAAATTLGAAMINLQKTIKALNYAIRDEEERAAAA